MKHHILSFLTVSGLLLGLFFLIQSLRTGEGQAMASSTGVAAKAISEDLRHSSAEKRSIRRVVMKSPEGLMQLSGRDVQAVLQKPELVRKDLPTVVWQYRNESCVLDVYFTTSSPKASQAPVVHYEVRARNKALQDADVQGVCVRDLVRARAGGNLVNIDALYKAD